MLPAGLQAAPILDSHVKYVGLSPQKVVIRILCHLLVIILLVALSDCIICGPALPPLFLADKSNSEG